MPFVVIPNGSAVALAVPFFCCHLEGICGCSCRCLFSPKHTLKTKGASSSPEEPSRDCFRGDSTPSHHLRQTNVYRNNNLRLTTAPGKHSRTTLRISPSVSRGSAMGTPNPGLPRTNRYTRLPTQPATSATNPARYSPTTTSTPPGSSNSRNRTNPSRRGRWCSVATAVTNPKLPSANGYVITSPSTPPGTPASTPASTSIPTNSPHTGRNACISSPRPHPTSSARLHPCGTAPSTKPWYSML